MKPEIKAALAQLPSGVVGQTIGKCTCPVCRTETPQMLHLGEARYVGMEPLEYMVICPVCWRRSRENWLRGSLRRGNASVIANGLDMQRVLLRPQSIGERIPYMGQCSKCGELLCIVLVRSASNE